MIPPREERGVSIGLHAGLWFRKEVSVTDILNDFLEATW